MSHVSRYRLLSTIIMTWKQQPKFASRSRARRAETEMITKALTLRQVLRVIQMLLRKYYPFSNKTQSSWNILNNSILTCMHLMPHFYFCLVHERWSWPQREDASPPLLPFGVQLTLAKSHKAPFPVSRSLM